MSNWRLFIGLAQTVVFFYLIGEKARLTEPVKIWFLVDWTSFAYVGDFILISSEMYSEDDGIWERD